jgi:hypothetical protein
MVSEQFNLTKTSNKHVTKNGRSRTRHVNDDSICRQRNETSWKKVAYFNHDTNIFISENVQKRLQCIVATSRP